MRLTLAFALFIIGSILMFGGFLSFAVTPLQIIGLFVMLTGLLQMAYIIGANLFPHTPPALEKLFANEKQVLWVFAPIVALIGVILWVFSHIFLHIV